ncbi:MAG: transglutaminase-like domain-containing protein [Pseudomonadales bacterium]|nr:transglutaminase-like domain-containing protein [Pseudomonadales bacterium]
MSNLQSQVKTTNNLTIFGYPNHRFSRVSEAEKRNRRHGFNYLIQQHFPKSQQHLTKLGTLSEDMTDPENYFAYKFSRLLYSDKVLNAVLTSCDLTEPFDEYLNKVLEVFLVRITGETASFESLGLLDHYMTLQKFAEADIPGLSIEAMLAFGEMAPIRNLCNTQHNHSFWQAAETSLSQLIKAKHGKEMVTFIKQSLQMPHRPFRPHDHDKLGEAIVEAFQPMETTAEKISVYEDIVKHWQGPEDIVNWAGKNYSYDFDRGSIMSAGNSLTVYEPQEFFERGCGVCIDFSHFIVSTLRKINPELRPYLFRMEYKIPNDFRGSPFYSHWSAAYQKQDKWFVLGDSKLGGMISGPYNTLDDYREDYSRYRGLEYHRHDLYEDLSVFYDLLR